MSLRFNQFKSLRVAARSGLARVRPGDRRAVRRPTRPRARPPARHLYRVRRRRRRAHRADHRPRQDRARPVLFPPIDEGRRCRTALRAARGVCQRSARQAIGDVTSAPLGHAAVRSPRRCRATGDARAASLSEILVTRQLLAPSSCFRRGGATGEHADGAHRRRAALRSNLITAASSTGARPAVPGPQRAARRGAGALMGAVACEDHHRTALARKMGYPLVNLARFQARPRQCASCRSRWHCACA